MIPGFLEEARRPQFLAGSLLLRFAEDVRFADLHRHVLAIGVFLDIRGEREAFDDVGSVILFLRPVAEEASQLLNSALTRFSSVLSPEKPVQADICLPTSADRST